VAELILTSYGFSIPGGATITKVEVLDFVDAYADPDSALSASQERTVAVTLDGGSTTETGSSVAITASVSKAERGPLDVTPDSAPSVAEVNNSNFGIVIEPTALAVSPVLDNVRHRVYHVTVRVTYSTTSGDGTGTFETDEVICLSSSTMAGVGETGIPPEDYSNANDFQLGTPIDLNDAREGGKCAYSGFWAPASRLVHVEGWGRVCDVYASKLNGPRRNSGARRHPRRFN
jgi:hypothetical protein